MTDKEVTAVWNFLSNHTHVLVCIARDPEIRLRDVASKVGITERAVQRIVADLVDGGYISRSRTGRRNRYDVHLGRPLRHVIASERTVGDLLGLFLEPGELEAYRRPQSATNHVHRHERH